MKPQKIDVEIEVPMGEVLDMIQTTADKNIVAALLVERTREKAAAECAAVGGHLDMARPPEFYIRRGSHVAFGGDWMLVASRWWAEVPDSFDPQRAAALTR